MSNVEILDGQLVEMPEKTEEEIQAGETGEPAVGTATIEKEEEDGVSVEEIMGTVPDDVKKGKEGTPSGVQKRIDRAVKAQKVAEKRATEAEEKASKLESEKIISSKPIAPDRDSFETVEEYQTAMDNYQENSYKFYNTQSTRKVQGEEAAAKSQENIDKFISKSEEMIERFPDFDEVVDGTDYQGLNDIFMGMDHAPQISYFLAMNPGQLSKIANLPQLNRAIEVGKLEQKFTAVKSKSTNAPAPIKPIEGQEEAVTEDTMKIKDDNDWFKKRQAERKAKLIKQQGG